MTNREWSSEAASDGVAASLAGQRAGHRGGFLGRVWRSLRRLFPRGTARAIGAPAIRDAEVRALFELMVRAVEGFGIDDVACARIRGFGMLPPERQNSAFAESYLAVENHLMESNVPRRMTRESLREEIRSRFPALVARSGLLVVFAARTKQRAELSREFVRNVLSRSFEAFGSSGLRVVWLLSWIEASSPDVPLPPLVAVREVPAASDHSRWTEVYQQVSKDFFSILSEHTGQERARADLRRGV